jgi:acyl-CoA reductase-like NAD-dependent aldehyde dehydrogenase
MELMLKPGTTWAETYKRCVDAAPEAFQADRVLNYWGGEWRPDGMVAPATSPLDGTVIAGPPFVDLPTAEQSVPASLAQHREWSQVPLDERRQRVKAAVRAMQEHREMLGLLLVWEIGKPWKTALADVDRCLEGVDWYANQIDTMLVGREPLSGPVSNIASWNYPMSVLMQAMLVQALAGNAVVAKTPTDGGLCCLTLACALAAREGLPFTLISGSGSELAPALVAGDEIACVFFVGGRGAGSSVERLIHSGKRYVLEQEGLNCWGVWEFTDWDAFTGHGPFSTSSSQPIFRSSTSSASGTRWPSRTPVIRFPNLISVR